MIAPDDYNVDWLKWIIGIWIPVSLGWIPISIMIVVNIYRRIDAVERRTEFLVGKATERIEAKLDNMQQAQDRNLRIAAEDRKGIAQNMVTREELERQIDRITSGIHRK